MIFSETQPEQKNKFHTRIDQFSCCVDVAERGKLFRKLLTRLSAPCLQKKAVYRNLLQCLPGFPFLKTLVLNRSKNCCQHISFLTQVR